MHRVLKIKNNPEITDIYTAFSQEFGPQFRFRGETHDFWELVCVTEGQISVAADSKIFTLKKGQAILHSPMQFHNITAMGSGSSSITVFSFSGNNIPHLENKVVEIGNFSRVKQLLELARKHFVIRHHFSIKEPKQKGSAHLLYVKRLELFLLELAEGYGTNSSKLSKGAENYAFIIKTINNNIEKRLSVTDLAALCNMSEINLQKTFSHYAGVGIMEYFNRIKMQRAAQLLNEGHSVKQAALQVGFHDQNYFSTVFKRITGHTPSRYKLKTEDDVK